MTREDWRNWGYRSRLSEICCKESFTPVINQQKSTAAAQLNEGNWLTGAAGDQHWAGLAMQNPFIEQQTALAGADWGKALQAAMPQIRKIAGAYGGAKASIFNTIGPSAARDAALANLSAQEYTSEAGLLNEQVNQAPLNLAQLGQSRLAYGTGLSAQGIQALGGASQTTKSVGDMVAQQRQSALAPWLALAQVAGSALSGPLGGSIFKPKRAPMPG